MSRLLTTRRAAVALAMCVAAIAVPQSAFASSSKVTLFPSNAQTVRDPLQITGRRVALPLPNCTTNPTDCNTDRQLNKLDGFDIDPRISLTFAHAVDAARVAADTTITQLGHHTAIGVNRVVYDSTTNTVYAHPVSQLAPDTTYELSVHGHGIPSASTTFTTESATVGLLNMRAQLDSGIAYALAGIAPNARGLRIDANVPAAGTTLSYTQDEGSVGGLVTVPVPITSATGASRYVFGSFLAPSWLNSDSVIPQIPTRLFGPYVRGQARLPFVLIVPAGAAPAGGWPVAIFGHGFGESDRDLFLAADLNASEGIATIATDVVGHGFGPRSTWNITTADGTTTSITAHARGMDTNGDGVIGSTDGVSAPLQPAVDAAYSNDGGLQQTVADVMSLVRAIGHGLDVTGDGRNDLRRTGVSYYGQSFGGIYGVMLAGTDPKVQVLALNVSGGPISEIARLSPSFRPLVEQDLFLRQPSLLNGGSDNFTEDMPLAGQAPVLDPVPGAIAIQAALAGETWLDRTGDPETYAPLIRLDPPRGSAPKRVLFQNAFGDQTVPNPTNYTVLAAGHLFDRESLYRNDKTAQATKNPHGFLLDPSFVQGNVPGQEQVVTFFASNGQTTIDPDGPGAVWEVPITSPTELLTLNF
ncbi:MAG TPA: Ig-like domain-containing protein [Micromonosporaceae bacterium]